MANITWFKFEEALLLNKKEFFDLILKMRTVEEKHIPFFKRTDEFVDEEGRESEIVRQLYSSDLEILEEAGYCYYYPQSDEEASHYFAVISRITSEKFRTSAQVVDKFNRDQRLKRARKLGQTSIVTKMEEEKRLKKLKKQEARDAMAEDPYYKVELARWKKFKKDFGLDKMEEVPVLYVEKP